MSQLMIRFEAQFNNARQIKNTQHSENPWAVGAFAFYFFSCTIKSDRPLELILTA